MFLRTKKINGQVYAYKVKNIWTDNGARQKSVKYLGKICKPKKRYSKSMCYFIKRKDLVSYVQNSKKSRIFRDLFSLELYNYGFTEKERGIWNNGFFVVDLKKLKVFNKKKPGVIEINEGFVHDASLRSVFKFNAVGDEEEVGFKLANTLIDAGIKVEKEIFIELFEKVYRG